MAWMQNLPVDLVLVRHGESEGNLFDKMKEGGVRSCLKSRHTSDFRLSDLVRIQANRTGKIVQEQIGPFDKMYCSEYVRAIETAAYMNLPESQFNTSSLIREMDSGSHRGLPHPLQEYEKQMAELSNGAWWLPYGGVGGESFADLSLRMRAFLNHLQETASGLRVLVVCHAHVIRAIRSLMEDVKAPEFDSLLRWEIPNCHIRWYTRREATGMLHQQHFKVIGLDMEEATNLKRNDTRCRRIEVLIQRPLLTAAQLRARAASVPQLLNSKDYEAERTPEENTGDPEYIPQ